ncbi:MAG: radical SAM protein, partial [Mariprofundaceae bacterium]|nr:radical SAM protein [Mariprofundaceae bacterium]
GYVIQWFRSLMPANSLAAVYGLSLDVAERKVLGDNIEIVLSAYDETNTRVPVKKIIRDIKSAEAGGFVGFTGVQSNQFPRTMDIARELRAAGIQVCIGGFHVSGCMAMLPELPADIQEAQNLGISLFIGEAEGRIDDVFIDALAGRMQPLYNYLAALPDISSAPPPFLPVGLLKGSMNSGTSFDAGRGCPFICSFCTIINVQGRKSRRRSVADIETAIRKNAAQGVRYFLITDDNFARNKDWEAIFDRLIELREHEGIDMRITLQVDTMCHRIKNFVEKAARAGTIQVFIGLEAVNPDNLKAAQKGQNHIKEYRKLMQAWRNAGVITCAGYILGFPTDTKERILSDIRTIQQELPVDLLEFFFLTPLPGSQNHQEMHKAGLWMDPDMNKYDLNHVTTHHAIMSKEEWEDVYQSAWDEYYSKEHITTIMRRAYASRNGISKIMFMSWWFYYCIKYEGMHPLEGGYVRKKHRKDRRPGLPVESPFVFYPKQVFDFVRKHAKMAQLALSFEKVKKGIIKDSTAPDYMDIALTPVTDDEHETLEMLIVNQPAARKKKTA